ncbi:alpha/beta hydrolase [Streptomyces sp. NPDC097619]|uniref:alpha/beta fold hydrolase n=1 Tax=Streptomyces sp. NPDC097619 TaxID=3157228 RepID=UPI00332F3969
MVRRFDLTGAGGLRLAAWEFTEGPAARSGPPVPAARSGPEGPAAPAPEGREGHCSPVLFLHGLMGRAAHWAGTARGLAAAGPPRRMFALDQRGHGHSDRPADGLPGGGFSREVFVADAAAAIEQLDVGPVTLVGHSMGALTGWQLAARRPDLVQALVIGDMRASALGAASQRHWEEWFRTWPLPFPGPEAVRRFFGEQDLWLERPSPARGEYFAEMMTQGPEGWRPVFSRRQMLRARETWVHDAHWEELAQVRCPTLVVRGLDGELGRAEAQEMVRVLPRGEYAEIPDAGHYLHYDQPAAWQAVLLDFLEGARV